MNSQQVNRILEFLEIAHQPPSLDGVDALLSAYTKKIAWESMSRIARKAQAPHFTQAHLFPDAFWESAIANGTGGTCYESNYAFLSLLKALGYEGYLTINNMHEYIGCHSAIILTIEDALYLVDAGMPFHVAIPFHPNHPTGRRGQFHEYRITPQGDDIYLIERTHHPKPYCYTLINKPIQEAQYQQILIHDYDENGLFLDRAIIVKVIHDQMWRFDSSAQPYQIEIFSGFSSDKYFQFLGKELDTVSDALAQAFQMSPQIILTALKQVGA